MMLRNLVLLKLCNDTRLTIKMMPTLFESTILPGKASGKAVFILKIPFIPSDMSFQFKRLYFPDETEICNEH